MGRDAERTNTKRGEEAVKENGCIKIAVHNLNARIYITIVLNHRKNNVGVPNLNATFHKAPCLSHTYLNTR